MLVSVISIFLIIAGLVVGLGAVTVIDLHGFCARKSSYWTVATIATHKITKPLIWLGILLLSLGLTFFYLSSIFLPRVAKMQLFLIAALVLNGVYLSFVISPALLIKEKQGKASELLSSSMQSRIAASMLVSFFGWWALVLSIAYIFSRLWQN